jgi:hypothetical protein
LLHMFNISLLITCATIPPSAARGPRNMVLHGLMEIIGA